MRSYLINLIDIVVVPSDLLVFVAIGGEAAEGGGSGELAGSGELGGVGGFGGFRGLGGGSGESLGGSGELGGFSISGSSESPLAIDTLISASSNLIFFRFRRCIP